MTKMTRKEALITATEIMNEWIAQEFADDDLAAAHTIEAINTLHKMIAQIDKQASRPKAKSQARLENEKMAREFIALIRDYGKPVNATWMTEHIRYCLNSQKAVQVAKIAEEWGAIERITIKKRTYYEYVDNHDPIV